MPSPEVTTIRRMQPLLGTFVHIEVEAAENPEALHAMIDRAYADVARVERLMSLYRPDSDLSRLHASDDAVEVDPWTTRVLTLALRLAERSNHAFNPTVGGAVVEAGRLPRPPGANGWLSAGRADDIEIRGNTVRRHRPVLLTLDGIAKGWAVDRAIARLRHFGIRQAVVNAGGDWRAIGRPQGIYVRECRSVRYLGQLVNGACATSAVHHQPDRFPGLLLDHQGFPLVRGGIDTVMEQSWTILAPSAWLADGLTKVAAGLAPEHAATVVEQLGGRLLSAVTPIMDRAYPAPIA